MISLLVAAYRDDIRKHLDLARQYRCGLEIQAFSHPDVLEGRWRTLIPEYRGLLTDFEGPLACHGAFFDMSIASEDPGIVAVTQERYRQSLALAAELHIEHIVFHTNFLPMIRTAVYRKQFIQRQVDFWNTFGYEAEQRGVWVALENMWDPDPHILKSIVEQVTAPNVGICLDISHAYLYNRAHRLGQWIDALAPHIIHCHMNNTRGVIDEHLALNVRGGVINYTELLLRLRELPRDPWLVVELDDLAAAEQSVRFIRNLFS